MQRIMPNAPAPDSPRRNDPSLGLMRRRFREGDRGPHVRWIRVGAVTGLLAIAIQEAGDFSLQMPANAAMFCVLAAIALHRSGGPT